MKIYFQNIPWVKSFIALKDSSILEISINKNTGNRDLIFFSSEGLWFIFNSALSQANVNVLYFLIWRQFSGFLFSYRPNYLNTFFHIRLLGVIISTRKYNSFPETENRKEQVGLFWNSTLLDQVLRSTVKFLHWLGDKRKYKLVFIF